MARGTFAHHRYKTLNRPARHRPFILSSKKMNNGPVATRPSPRDNQHACGTSLCLHPPALSPPPRTPTPPSPPSSPSPPTHPTPHRWSPRRRAGPPRRATVHRRPPKRPRRNGVTCAQILIVESAARPSVNSKYTWPAAPNAPTPPPRRVSQRRSVGWVAARLPRWKTVSEAERRVTRCVRHAPTHCFYHVANAARFHVSVAVHT